MGRTAQPHSQTKEKLLEAARQLMLAKGFTATTVDEICAEAGLTKGGFFHYFGNKDELGKAVLDLHMTTMFKTAQEAPFFTMKDPLRRIYGYLDFLIEISAKPEGLNRCLLGNFAQVLSDTHPEIREQCAGHLDWWAGILKGYFDEARNKYAPRKSIDTGSLADHFIAVFQGALILAKAKRDVKIIEKSLLHCKQYVQSLFEKRS